MAGRLMRFVLVLSLLAGLVAALPAPVAVAAGRMGAAAPVNSVPEQPPVDLGKVSVGSRAVTELPPVGSPQRKDLDEVRAAADAAAARARTKLTQVHVAGAAAPVTSAVPATARVSCGDGGVPYDLRWQDLGLTAPPFLPTGGRQKLRLTMTGAGSLAAGAAYVSYHLGGPSGLPWVQYDGNPQQDITVAFGQGQTVDVEAPLAGLSPGSHYVAWDVFVRGYGWLSEHGVCALGIQYNVPNRPPNITVLGPPNGGTSLSRTPTLAAVADDPDKYPNGESRYRFTMCGDQAMTASCRDSGWQDHWAYQVPDGYARWNETVWWKVEATDGALTTTSPVLSVTVVPPAPDRWRTVGSGLNLATVQGVVLPFGMYTRQSTDLAVATESAPKLEVTRGYSSAATVAGYVGAMGRGWLGLFDSQVSWDEGQQALTVTYPDGRQQVFGKNTDGSYASRLDTGSSNTVRLVGGFYEVQTGGGEVLRFAGGTGQLAEIVVRPAIYNKSLRLDRDGEGRVVGLTQLNSGRRMQVEWNPPGVDQGCRSRELLKAITTEAPQPGQAPTRIEYHYTGCDLLDEVCQIGVGCERYSYDSASRLVGGTSRAGRPLDRVVYRAPGAAEVARVEVAADTAQGTDFQYFDLPPNDPEQQDYLDHVNRWAGRTVQTSDGKDQTYKFDELNRLIELDHVPVRTATTNYRLWNYSPYTGRLETFFNENFEVTHIIPNPNGDIGTRWSYRSPDHIVGVNYSYDYFADATDPRTSRMTSAAPYDEYTKPYVPETFAYADYHGLLQSRTPAHDTGTSVGAEQYSYTNGIGSPEDLLFSVTNGTGTTTYDRNAAGDVVELRNTATGARVTVERDDLGRMMAKIEYSAAYPQGVRTTYRYDTAGNLSGVTEPSTTDAVTGEAHQLVVDRVFDGDGRLRSETDSDVPASARWLAAHPGQADADPYIRVSSYQYAADGTLAELSSPNGAVYRYTYVRGQVATVTDPAGNVDTYHYDSQARLFQVDRRSTDGVVRPTSKYGYDPAGNLLSEMDATGQVTRYRWSSDGLPTRAARVVPASGTTAEREVELWTRAYDQLGNVTSEVAAAGTRTTTSIYSVAGHLTDQVLDPTGVRRAAHYTYDQWGRPIQATLSDQYRNQTTKLGYDDGGRLTETRVVASTGDLVTTKTYDEYGRVLTITDPRGAAGTPEAFTTSLRYDETGRVVEERGPPHEVEDYNEDAATISSITTYGYNAFGEQEHLRDPRGGVTTAEFDRLGQTLAVHSPTYTAPGGAPTDGVVRYRYNLLNQLDAKTDAVNGLVTYTYDAYGDLTSQTGPKDGDKTPVTRYDYAPGGLLSRMTGPTGAVVDFAYDAFSHVTAKTSVVRVEGSEPVRYSTTFVYDDAGRLISQTDPDDVVILYGHNGAGDTTSVDPGRGKMTYRYDFAGNLVSQSDLNRTAVTTYDDAGRPTQTSVFGAGPGQQLPGPTTTYDAAGNAITIVTGEGRRSERTYDSANQLRSLTEHPDPDTALTTSFGYDAAGDRTRVTDAEGNTTWQTYTPWQLPEREIDPPTATFPAEADRTWTTGYDPSGLPNTEQRPGGVTVSRVFNAAGNLTSETGAGPNTPAATRTLGYDLAGRVTSVLDPAGTQTLTYDDRGLLRHSEGPAGASTFGYTAAGRTSERTDASGTSDFYYDQVGDPFFETYANAGAVATHYNDDGSIATQDINNATRTPSYDDFGRTTGHTLSANGAPVDTLTYTYDRDSKVTSKTSTADLTYGGTYRYDGAARLKTWTPADGAPSQTYQLDGVGNRLTTTSTATGAGPVTTEHSTFDTRNQLLSRELPGQSTTTYDYTARGTTAGRTTTDAAGSAVSASTVFDGLDRMVNDHGIAYTYDSLDRIASRNNVSFGYAGGEDNPVLAPAADPAQQETITRGPGGAATGVSNSGGSNLTLPDNHGDIRSLLGVGNTFEGTRSFTPTGESRAASGTTTAAGFQGDWTDTPTGSVWMGARWLDPQSGRFTSRDSSALSAENAAGANRYLYGAGDPIGTVDPSGHSALPWDWGAGNWLDDAARTIGGWAGDLGAAVGDSLEWLSKLPVWAKIPAKIGGRFVPVVGWGLLALDGIELLQGLLATGTDAVSIPTVAAPVLAQPYVTPAAVRPPPPPPPTVVKTVTRRVPVSWMEPEKTTYAPGYRITTYTQHIDTYKYITLYWSNGFTQPLPGFLDEWATYTWSDAIPTIDPSQAERVIVGTSDDISGHTDVGSPMDHLGGCGLQGTEIDCVGEALGPTLGGCFTLTSTIQGCYPNTPNPQASAGKQEQRGTHDNSVMAGAEGRAGAPAGPPTTVPPAGPGAGSCMPDPDDGDWVDPNLINFSQRTVSPNDYVSSMLDGSWDWNRPGTALKVLDRGGQLVSYDNRRLDAAREARQQIPGYKAKVQRLDPNSPNPAKTSGMNWDKSFEKRMTSKRNQDENGCRVPWQGLYERPDIEGK